MNLVQCLMTRSLRLTSAFRATSFSASQYALFGVVLFETKERKREESESYLEKQCFVFLCYDYALENGECATLFEFKAGLKK